MSGSVDIDTIALEVARRFTQDTEPQLRASLQVAVIEAIKLAKPALREPAEAVGMPGAHWRQAGGADPHGDTYACERVALAHGDMTDDELANAVFLCDHRRSLDSIGLLTAAKDRIRWLSRALAAKGAAPAPVVINERMATPRRMAAVELLISLGYKWPDDEWAAPAPAPAVSDAADIKGWRLVDGVHVYEFVSSITGYRREFVALEDYQPKAVSHAKDAAAFYQAAIERETDTGGFIRDDDAERWERVTLSAISAAIATRAEVSP